MATTKGIRGQGQVPRGIAATKARSRPLSPEQRQQTMDDLEVFFIEHEIGVQEWLARIDRRSQRRADLHCDPRIRKRQLMLHGHLEKRGNTAHAPGSRHHAPDDGRDNR